jgi:hypothetical protein
VLLQRTEEHRSSTPCCNGDAKSGSYNVRWVFIAGSCTTRLGSKSQRTSRHQCAARRRQKKQESVNCRFCSLKILLSLADTRRNLISICCGKSKCNNITKSISSSSSPSSQKTVAATVGDSNGFFKYCIASN